MSYKIIRTPFMLLETVSMLYKYVNGITSSNTLNQLMVDQKNKADWGRVRRVNKIYEILNEVCADLDPQEPELQRLFGRVECGCEDVCLAQLLTYSFCTLRKPGFREHIEEICDVWQRLQEKQYWIQSGSSAALDFSTGIEHPGSLLRQVRALNYPAEFRLELCDALEHFDDSLHHLADLLEPLSMRLEEIYRREWWIFEEIWSYWDEAFQTLPPMELLERMGMKNASQHADEMTWVALSVMNTNCVVAIMDGSMGTVLEHNCLLMGGAITTASVAIRHSARLDGVLAVLKCLSDRKRLEILCRLSKGRSYGQEISETLNMDPGNVSRNLGMLHNYGLLKQERTSLRAFYETDQKALHDFLVRLEDTLLHG